VNNDGWPVVVTGASAAFPHKAVSPNFRADHIRMTVFRLCLNATRLSPEVLLKRIEIAITVKKRKALFDAEGGDPSNPLSCAP